MPDVKSREIDLSRVPYPLDLLSLVSEGFDSIKIEGLGDKRFRITGDPEEIHYVINEVGLQAGA